MWIINKDSRSSIKIGITDIGSYLEIDKPVVLDWSDCKGSMGRYCTMMGFKEEKFILYYLKKLFTNSYLLKTCKSSIPSPTPMYLTGI